MLSGYRLMWLMVMFDLPVLTKAERKAATGFRNFLLDEGFEMTQFSVYMRHVVGKEQAEAVTKRVEKSAPRTGKIRVIFLTDKQYENTRILDGRAKRTSPKNPDQYMLF